MKLEAFFEVKLVLLHSRSIGVFRFGNRFWELGHKKGRVSKAPEIALGDKMYGHI